MPGKLWIILAATLWGTTGTAQALAPTGANPLAVGAMRLLLGSVVLVLVSAARDNLRPTALWRQPAMLLSIVMTALYQVSFFAGVALTGVAVGTLVGIGSAPIFAGLLGALVRGEPLGRRWFVATGLAVLGVLLLALSGQGATQINPLGMLLATGAGLAYALFTLFSRRMIDQMPADAVMAVTFAGGALLLLPVLLVVETRWIATPDGLLVVLHLGLVATGLSYIFFGQGLRTVPVSVVGTLTLAEPLTAALLGIFLLGEVVTGSAVLGILTLFTGLGVLVVRPPKPHLAGDETG